MSNTFPKGERLCGNLRVATLHKTGKRFRAYPLRVTYLIKPADQPSANEPVKVLVWAPKKLFRRAVMRNHLRRLMREAYRLHVQSLRESCQAKNCQLGVSFLYISPDPTDFYAVEKSMCHALAVLEKKITDYQE